MNNSKWNVPKTDPVIPAALQSAGYTPLLAAMLHVRGLSTPEQARNFLENSPALLDDPLPNEDECSLTPEFLEADSDTSVSESEVIDQLPAEQFPSDPYDTDYDYL